MTPFQHSFTAIVLLPLLVSSTLSADGPLVLEKTIALKGVAGKLDHVAVDSVGLRLFVANKPNNTLDIVDLKTGKMIKQIPDQGKVSGVVYAPDLEMIFVGNGAGTCNGFDAREFKLVFSVKADKADNVAYHAGTKTVYVAHGSTISAFDAKTGEPKTKVELPGEAHGILVDAKAEKLFVSLTGPSQIGVIDLTKQVLTDKYPLTLAEGNSPIAHDAAEGRIYVGCRKKPLVVVLDSKTGKELLSIAIPAGVDDLQFDAARGRLYASCDDGLAVIERKGEKYETLVTLNTPKASRTCTFSDALGKLYLAVPKQEGKDGPEVRVYKANPTVEIK